MTEPPSRADDTAPTPSEDTRLPVAEDLGSALNQMAGWVLSRETVETALELVTTLATTVTPGTLGAAVTVVDEHGRRSRAASNDRVEQADALQYEFDEGPCLTAWGTQELIRIDDTTTDDRWPRWSPAVSRLGVRSVLSAPLLAAGEAVGAMKVYSDRPQNYGRPDEHVLRLFAAQAAILLADSQSLRAARRLGRQLTGALASRDLIAQATGVLLARGAASPQAAFATLAATARQSSRPVEDVARTLVAAAAARDSDPGP
jgi:GAF domain-containing protein